MTIYFQGKNFQSLGEAIEEARKNEDELIGDKQILEILNRIVKQKSLARLNRSKEKIDETQIKHEKWKKLENVSIGWEICIDLSETLKLKE